MSLLRKDVQPMAGKGGGTIMYPWTRPNPHSNVEWDIRSYFLYIINPLS